MASTSGGQEASREIPIEAASTASPLKRLLRKSSGASSLALRRKSTVKVTEAGTSKTFRGLYKSPSLRRPSSSALTSKVSMNRPSFLPRHQDLDSAKKNSLPSGKYGTLTKRLNLSRLGTIRSGVDNRFRFSKVKETSSGQESEDAGPSEVHIAVTIPSAQKPKQPDVTLSRKEIARQLKALFGRVCETEYDMYQLLDERDKILSKARVKSSDVENAVIAQGTCVDMCPEKERYLRVFRKQISVYECDLSGTMIPDLTVKDYSRSAADQEEPLPHELRSGRILCRTMNYLIGKIAEEVPTKNEDLSVWYDFLWNRTRAIRKDITQQMMVNETAVHLNEQCARFHIFAAHRLCKLDSNEFDQKINTENLSKCLQSLRHLYEDLAKKGVYCRTEAEFRSYDIMLNLADSYISKQVLAYRSEIRTSPEVKLALELFISFQNCNYRRFFKLLKERANYLQCCICHRYFAEFREHSLSIIVEAFTASGSASAKYPLSKLPGLLGFDDEEQSREFATSYGFECKFDPDLREEHVLLSRADFIQKSKERPVLLHSWIEQKRSSMSVSEVLSGGEHVVVERWKPTVSFYNGRYTNDPVVSDFLSQDEGHDDSTDSAASSQPTINGSKLITNVEKCTEYFLTYIVNDTVEMAVTSMASKVFKYSSIATAITSAFDTVFNAALSDTCMNVLEKMQAVHRRKLAIDAANQRKEKLKLLIGTWSDKLLDEVVTMLLRSVYRKVSSEMSLKRRKKSLEQLSSKLYGEIANEVLNAEVMAISTNVYEENDEVCRRCKEIRKRLDRLWLKQFFDQWRSRVLWKRARESKVRRLLETFPAILPAKSALAFPGEMKPLECDPMKLVRKSALENLRQRRSIRITRDAFLHWKLWAKDRGKNKTFFKDFFYNSTPNLRKRHFPATTENDLSLRWALLQNEKRWKRDGFLSAPTNEEIPSTSFLEPEIAEDVRIALCDMKSIGTTPVKSQKILNRHKSLSSLHWHDFSSQKNSSLNRFSDATVSGNTSHRRDSFNKTENCKKSALEALQTRLLQFNKELAETASMVSQSTARHLHLLNGSVNGEPGDL